MWVTKNTKYVGGIVLEFKSISTFRVPFALVSCNNLCILEQNLQIIITRGRLGWMSNILLKGPTNPVIFSSRIVSRTRATHTWVRFPRTGKMVKMWHFFNFFLKLCCDHTVIFFSTLSTVLKRFCPLNSKNERGELKVWDCLQAWDYDGCGK